MISTGNSALDSFLGEYPAGITVIYGQPGTGKTTLAKLAALAAALRGKKVLYIDTEHGFRVERLQQLEGFTPSVLDRILVIKPAHFQEQEQRIYSLITLSKKFDLIVIDTIGAFYRQHYRTDIQYSNASLEKQLRILKEVGRTIPILLVNQVYSTLSGGTMQMVGHKFIEPWCARQILLKKDPRVLIQEKPVEKKIPFTITAQGLSFSSSPSLL